MFTVKIFEVLMLATFAFGLAAFAEQESTTNKVKDASGDTKTDVKKDVRTAKRNARKATGHDNALKDAKDGANDAGDTMSNEVDKAKRKTEPQ